MSGRGRNAPRVPKAYGVSHIAYSVVIARDKKEAQEKGGIVFGVEPETVLVEGRAPNLDHYGEVGWIPGHELITNNVTGIDCDECGEEITAEGIPLAIWREHEDFCSKTCQVRYDAKRVLIQTITI